MTFELRNGRYLTCFYCGKRSSQKLQGKVPQWKCTYCESVNHLDKYGFITDPPASASGASPAPTPVRYAHARSPSPPSLNGSSPVFCTTCIKNQHIIQQNLAQYLPPENDPKYAQFLATQDKYKRDLERRYPPVCSSCAPQVRARIKRAAYVARTDHLRRMMERTRKGAIHLTRDGNWRSLLFRIAGLSWWIGALGQVCWHTVESLLLYERRLATIGSEAPVLWDRKSSVKTFLEKHHGSMRQAQQLLLMLMPFFICVSFATMWWNSRMRAKYLGKGGRMINLGQYYMLQVLLMGVRVALWLFWGRFNTYADARFTYDSTTDRTLGFHVVVAGFMLLTTLILSATVRLDTQPIVSFHITDDMILPEIPHSDTTVHEFKEDVSPKKFPIDRLHQQDPAPQSPSKPQSLSAESIALVNQQYDAEPMDWTPTGTPKASSAYNFRSKAPQQITIHGPSPFTQQVPPAPRRGFPFGVVQTTSSAASQFSKVSNTEQYQVTNNFRRRAPSTTTIMTEDTAEDVQNSDGESIASHATSALPRKKKEKNFTFANPKFFPAQVQVDTGLETMFDQAFYIGEEQDTQELSNSQEDVSQTGVSMFDWRPPESQQSGKTWLSLGLVWSFFLFGVLPAAMILGSGFMITKYVFHEPNGFYTAFVRPSAGLTGAD